MLADLNFDGRQSKDLSPLAGDDVTVGQRRPAAAAVFWLVNDDAVSRFDAPQSRTGRAGRPTDAFANAAAQAVRAAQRIGGFGAWLVTRWRQVRVMRVPLDG